MPAGRPTKCTKEVIRQARDYIDNYAEYEHAIPSVAGLSLVIKVARSNIYKWAEKEGSDFQDILANINTKQEQVLISKGLLGDFNSNITKLVLGKHGYHEKSEREHSGGVRFIASQLDEDI